MRLGDMVTAGPVSLAIERRKRLDTVSSLVKGGTYPKIETPGYYLS